MAAGTASRVIRSPGRVILGPTNLASPPNYGGTEIGLTRLCVLQPIGSQGFTVRSESLGEPTDILEGSNEFVFSCLCRGMDDDAMALLFPDRYSVGSVSKHAVFSVPGANVPGASALSRAVKLLYVPDDVVNVPSLLIYRGVPDFAEGAEVAFDRREELGFPIAIHCLRDANNLTLKIGRIVDLSLT